MIGGGVDGGGPTPNPIRAVVSVMLCQSKLLNTFRNTCIKMIYSIEINEIEILREGNDMPKFSS